MPIRRLLAVVLALASVGALTVTGIALAAGSSSVTGFSFTPQNPHGVFTSGRLFLATHTEYTDATVTTRIHHKLDDDFQFNPNSFPKCNSADISGNLTMQEALQECGPAAGPANNAWLHPPATNVVNGTALFNLGTEFPNACVLAFNGSGSKSEILLFIRMKLDQHLGPIDCANPKTNTDGDSSFVVEGDLKPNGPIGDDYADPDNCSAPDPRRGCRIDLKNVSNGPIRLVDLSVAFRRDNYVRARCVDPHQQWNLRATFTYTNLPGKQTVHKSQSCT
jgi:hypothetical protein